MVGGINRIEHEITVQKSNIADNLCHRLPSTAQSYKPSHDSCFAQTLSGTFFACALLLELTHWLNWRNLSQSSPLFSLQGQLLAAPQRLMKSQSFCSHSLFLLGETEVPPSFCRIAPRRLLLPAASHSGRVLQHNHATAV
ncbi:hypothetical protein Tcan_00714, partial [Toxocara canis]